VKLAPEACPISRSSQFSAGYRILLSVSPMTTTTQTTHGSEVHTVNQPVSGTVDATTTYSDGSTAGIGNAIRAAKDRHRADKLYEDAIRAIMADSQDGVSQVRGAPEQ